MRYMALATDFDGTLTTNGQISSETASALERLRASGRRVILVTGRLLDDLKTVCPRLDLFDYVVVENGAVLYDPRTRKETILAVRPPDALIHRLERLGVTPLQVGRIIVATWLPHHIAALQAIQELGLELQIVFNRSAVMILPTGVNKASGMDAALRKLGLSPHEVVGIGDSANDHSFLLRSECPVAVADAEPSIRELASFVTSGEAGRGVTELVDMLITVYPWHLAPSVLSMVDVAIAVGRSPQETLQGVAKAIGQRLQWPDKLSYERSSAVVWFPRRDEMPFSMKIQRGRTERIRHHRKYAVGDMRLDSFYFTGPGNRHHLKAQNLVIFSQIADGIDEETWLYHLRRGDYSKWFRGAVKDSYLADHAARIEQRKDLSPAKTRELIRGLIEARYTLPE